MKRLLPAVLLFIVSIAKGQSYQVSWGDESKLKRKTTDMELVAADKTGVYFLAGELGVKNIWWGGMKTNYKLLKFDNQFEKVYEQDYKKDLKDYNFQSVQPLKDKLFLFADNYDKKNNIFTVYATTIDKTSGELAGEPLEIASFSLESDKDNVDYIVRPSLDSTMWIVASAVKAHDNSSTTLHVTALDIKLKRKANANIVYSENPESFSFEDIVCTKDNRFLVLTKKYDIVPKGKKRTTKIFTGYSLIRYSGKGVKEASYNLDSSDTKRYTTGGKLVTLKNGNVLFAGFYSNSADKKQINGIYTTLIDLSSNKLSEPSIQPLSKNMLSDVTDSATLAQQIAQEAGADDKQDKGKKGKEDGNGSENFESSYIIRSVLENPDHQSFWIVAESYEYYVQTYTYMTTDLNTKIPKTVTDTRYTFINGSLMLINTSLNGQINKIKVVPKKQTETIYDKGSSIGYVSVNLASFFVSGNSIPYYSSISSLIYKNKLLLFFNDLDKNATVTEVGENVKIEPVGNSDFKKTKLYALSIDLGTYETERKELFANGGKDDIIAMPRFGLFAGEDLYLTSVKMILFGRFNLHVGKINIK